MQEQVSEHVEFGLIGSAHEAKTLINRLLKPHGLRLSIKVNYPKWGDQVEVRLIRRNNATQTN